MNGEEKQQMREETRQDLMSAGEMGTKYDEAAKEIWRNREILAPLLKYSIEELKDESVESIMKLIDTDSISEDTPVSDLPATIVSLGTEQSSTTEKIITFDLKFKVKNPKLSLGNLLVMLHVDLEFQNKYRPVLKDGRSYPLIKRGIYYVAREVSSQLGRITNQTNYADIEKVVGIWVVNEDVPKDKQNTATRYYITKEDYIGSVDEPEEDYDLIEVVMIRRGENGGITEPLFKYLRSVYEADIEEIDKYTPVSDNPELKEEVLKMPGMSQVIYDQGVEEGISQGIEQGQNLLIETIQRLKNGESREKIIASGVDEHTVDLACSVR